MNYFKRFKKVHEIKLHILIYYNIILYFDNSKRYLIFSLKLCCLSWLVTAKNSSRFARHDGFRCAKNFVAFMLHRLCSIILMPHTLCGLKITVHFLPNFTSIQGRKSGLIVHKWVIWNDASQYSYCFFNSRGTNGVLNGVMWRLL